MSINFSLNFEKNKFFKVLKKYDYKITIGDILAGKIISFEKAGYFIEIGIKILAYLPISELFYFQYYSQKEILKFSDIYEFIILTQDVEDNLIIVSINKLKSKIIWQRLKEISRENLITFGHLQKSTKHGKIVNLQGFNSFIFNSDLPKYYRRKQLHKLILPLNFIEIKDNENKIFLSCKLAYFKNQIKFLKVQQSFCGCITQIKSYGLFINIYGLKSFLHISEISSERIKNLTILFKKGQIIVVTILYINTNQGKISLSAKISE
jgi:small subunit ribosomal protein S1